MLIISGTLVPTSFDPGALSPLNGTQISKTQGGNFDVANGPNWTVVVGELDAPVEVIIDELASINSLRSDFFDPNGVRLELSKALEGEVGDFYAINFTLFFADDSSFDEFDGMNILPMLGPSGVFNTFEAQNVLYSKAESGAVDLSNYVELGVYTADLAAKDETIGTLEAQIAELQSNSGSGDNSGNDTGDSKADEYKKQRNVLGVVTAASILMNVVKD